jgi:hypothetical protein
LLGNNLERLAFEERQAVAQCLINKVVVTGEHVDIHFVLPFASPPQLSNRSAKAPEGAPGHFYWLRLADFDPPSAQIDADNLPRGDRLGQMSHEDFAHSIGFSGGPMGLRW